MMRIASSKYAVPAIALIAFSALAYWCYPVEASYSAEEITKVDEMSALAVAPRTGKHRPRLSTAEKNKLIVYLFGG